MPSRPATCRPRLPAGRARRRERGASAVEFALVLPLFMLLIGGVIDFGFIFAQQIAFNTATRDAARAGVLPTLSGTTRTCSDIAQQARVGAAAGAVGVTSTTGIAVTVTGTAGSCSLAAGSSAASGSSTIKPCTASATSATTDLQVTLSYQSKPPFPVPFMGTVTLGSKGNFQCEYT